MVFGLHYKNTWTTWNLIYFLIIGYCVLFGLTWLWLMDYQAGQRVAYAAEFEEIAVELYENNMTACASKYCETSRVFCGLYNDMRIELQITSQGQEIYKEQRDRYDSLCGINGTIGRRCFPIMVEEYYGV